MPNLEYKVTVFSAAGYRIVDHHCDGVYDRASEACDAAKTAILDDAVVIVKVRKIRR